MDFVIVRFLMKLFNTNNITLITWTSLIIVDNILRLNCLVLSGPIVSEGLRKSLPNVTIFSAKFQLSFCAVCFSVFFSFATIMVNKDVYCSGK